MKTPLQQMIIIQTLQHELDTAKKKQKHYQKQVRELAQKIPKLIRDLQLQ